MSKHTPGPWLIRDEDGEISVFVPSDRGTEYRLADRIGGEVFKGEDGRFSDYSRVQANARLIAAAPELLEVLAEYGMPLTGDDHRDAWEFGEAAFAREKRRRAAILKATGEQP